MPEIEPNTSDLFKIFLWNAKEEKNLLFHLSIFLRRFFSEACRGKVYVPIRAWIIHWTFYLSLTAFYRFQFWILFACDYPAICIGTLKIELSKDQSQLKGNATNISRVSIKVDDENCSQKVFIYRQQQTKMLRKVLITLKPLLIVNSKKHKGFRKQGKIIFNMNFTRLGHEVSVNELFMIFSCFS